MNHDLGGISADRRAQLETIERAATDAVREALHRHMLLGESVAVADENGNLKLLGPEELRRLLTAA